MTGAPVAGTAPAMVSAVAAPTIVEAPRAYTGPAMAAPAVMAAPKTTYSYIPPQGVPVMEQVAPSLSYLPAAQPIPTVAPTVVTAPPVYVEAPAVAPTVMSMPPPQQLSYLPAAPVVVEQAASFVPAEAPRAVEPIAQTTSYIPTVAAPAIQYPPMVQAAPVMAAPTMAGPPMMVEAVQTTNPALAAVPAGQSVIVEQIGDWLVCEDQLGIFYHHNPTQQSHDVAPPEFLMMFPGGYTPPASYQMQATPGAVMESPGAVMTYATPVAGFGQGVPMAAPMMGVEAYPPQILQAGTAPGGAAPVMAKVLN